MVSEYTAAVSEADRLCSEANPYLPDVPNARRVRKFTPGRKRAFVGLLADGYSPTRAAGEVGVSRQAAYRQRASDPDFADAWDEALERQADLYEDALRKAAIEQRNIGGIIFGLKNLRPWKWRDRHEVEVERRGVDIQLSSVVPPEALQELQRRYLAQQGLLPQLPGPEEQARSDGG